MKTEYEINIETLAILPIGKNHSKIIEQETSFIVMKTPLEIIKNSCNFFGSSYNGRHEGTKSLIGISYKAPIIIEESNNLIFFPTSSPRYDECIWIAFNHILRYEKNDFYSKILFQNGKTLSVEISYGSLQNQVLRASLLENVIRSRKIVK